jgi:hypothetical protein
MRKSDVLNQYPRGSVKITYVLDHRIADIDDECVATVLERPHIFLGPRAKTATASLIDAILPLDRPVVAYYVTIVTKTDVETVITKKSFEGALRYMFFARDHRNPRRVFSYRPDIGLDEEHDLDDPNFCAIRGVIFI